MGHQNVLYTGPMLNLEPQHVHPHPEPGVLSYDGLPSFPQPNASCTILPPPGNGSSFNLPYLPENHVHLPYMTTQYDAEHCNTFMIPSPSPGVFAVPVNQGCHNHSPFSNNHQVFQRDRSLFMEGSNYAVKRKNIERFPGNSQFFYPAPGSSSSVSVPMISEGTNTDATSFEVPEHSGNNDIQLGMDSGLDRSVRNNAIGTMGIDHVVVHNNGHLIHSGQPVQTVLPPWLDQHTATSTFSWNHAHGMPHPQGYINGGGIEGASMRLHGFQATAMSRNSVAFMHPPITPHQGPHLYHPPPPPPMPLLQAQNMDIHSHLASSSNRHSTVTTTTANPYQNGVDPGPRFFGPPLLTDLGVYETHHQALMFVSSARHHSFPSLRVLPEDELLALGEQTSDTGSGLSDNFISDHLKTRTFGLLRSSPPEDQISTDEHNFCVICQMEFDDQEKIGELDCSHEYHVECIKKWLTVKNNCPICKSTALALLTN